MRNYFKLTQLRKIFLTIFFLCGCLISNLTIGSAKFQNNILNLPYVVVGSNLYNVSLRLVQNSNPIDLTLWSYYQYPIQDIETSNNESVFSGNVLSIPILRSANKSYRLQLDYIESEEVFRLLEPVTTLQNSTDGILCNYIDSTPNNQQSLTITSKSEWGCVGGNRTLTANGIPDHDVGVFPNPHNPNTISEQSVTAEFPLSPEEGSSPTTLGGRLGPVAYVLNGVKVDADTAGACDDSGDSCSLAGGAGSWGIEALGQPHFDFGDDENHAHVQPGGTYHYHGIPEGFVAKQGGNSSTMTIIGWAVDGFPIYARYGYSVAGDSSSNLKSMEGSYRLVGTINDSRPPTSMYSLGTFKQDWEYIEGLGDLDECNGRWGVTPEFPQGIYHYYATDSYPYFQRCVKGSVEALEGAGDPPGGGPTGGDASRSSSNTTGKQVDRYACEINSDGFCIFTGDPHQLILEPGTDKIVNLKGEFVFNLNEAVAVNKSGEILEAKGTPAFDGDTLIKMSKEKMSEDEKSFHKVMTIMFPIRNALMYNVKNLSKDAWSLLVEELTKRGIKNKTFLEGRTPKDNYYGTEGIFDLVQNPRGQDIHHDVMKFLEEAGLYLLCHVTSDEFNNYLKETHPEGHDACKEAILVSKVPFTSG